MSYGGDSHSGQENEDHRRTTWFLEFSKESFHFVRRKWSAVPHGTFARSGNSPDGVRLQVAPSDRGPKARTQSCGHTAHGLGSEFGKQAQKMLHLFRPDVL